VSEGFDETVADAAKGAPAKVPGSVGRYRIERVLGEGGMGVVYAAFDPDLERRVALKLLAAQEGGSELRARLLREARAMARLAHTNVVTVYEVGTEGGRDYVAMELVEGANLKAWLEAESRTPDDVVGAFLGAGAGLAAAHRAGIVHRDFKPHNVLVRKDGRVMVTDFGLARGVETAPAIALETTLRPGAKPEAKIDSTPSSLSGLTQTGSVLGTPAYMAPEQWTGAVVGPPADQFAFCVALWEALTGARPFAGPTLENLREQVQRGEVDASKLPRGVREALVRGLRPDPDNRWPNMDALLASLQRRRRRLPYVIAASAAAVAIAIATLAMVRGPSEPSCPAPAIDPGRLGARGAEVAKVRAQVCALDPAARAPQLECLDGVLARIQLGADALMIDPAICARPQPPRLVRSISPMLREAALAGVAARDKKPTAADAAALVTRADKDACAAVFAHLVSFAAGSDPHQQIADANDAAQRCGDDWLRAQLAILALRDSLESTISGPEVNSRLKTAITLAEVVGDPAVTADLDVVRADADKIGDKLDDSIAALDRAAAAYELRGRPRDRARTRLRALQTRRLRGTAADLTGYADRLAELRVASVKQLGETHEVVRDIDLEMADWLFFTGRVADAHARYEALRRHEPPDHPVHASGIVVDDAGKPVAGATVATGPYMRGDSIAVVVENGPQIRTAITRADGTFDIPDAADDSVVLAGLGDRRSLAADVGEHLTLTLAPTSRIEGRVELGDIAAPRVIVQVRTVTATSGDIKYAINAPVAADGSFVVDGVPRAKVKVVAALLSTSAQIAGVIVDVKTAIVRDVGLALQHGTRSIDVIVRSTVGLPLPNAQVVVFRGSQPTVIKLSVLNAHALSGRVKLASHFEGTSPSPAISSRAKAGDLWATIADIPDGPTSVCAVGLPLDLSDPALEKKLKRSADLFELHCVPVPATNEPIVIETTPAPRLD
jgi:predicted Ser/Thr protein kinase